ncbi:hypothetical protein B0T24DRAFT_673887 [Lasiosphaeria ovina]|uniref:Uncharacterized protein n=1 Tax=Lasiosphaeria ovina TaxID=92902 RepID=A0AAE0NM78_9PEZI|nr:hypothetical protein B0T24DRAFT_673887 [Lasiosphaeria ovina]
MGLTPPSDGCCPLEGGQSLPKAAIEVYKTQIDSTAVDIFTKAALVTDSADSRLSAGIKQEVGQTYLSYLQQRGGK